MCRGREEERKECLSEDESIITEAHPCPGDHDHEHGSEFDSSVFCELCDSEASVYCQADDAFLCRKCDRKVHAANFIAQRHIRCFLCNTCHSLTHRYLIRDAVQVVLPTIVCKKEMIRTKAYYNNKLDDMEPKYFIRPFLFL